MAKKRNPTLMLVANRPRRANPTLMLVAGNPSGATLSAAKDRWCRFHQRDEFDGRRSDVDLGRGAPEIVFAIGRCAEIDLGGGPQSWNGSVPLLCCDVSDESLWLLSPSSPLNVGPVKGASVHAVVYDPVAETGKDDALYHHDFSRPLPTLAPVGDPRRTRAVRLDGGRYRVRDWLYD